jgi:hypothetical protein
VDLFLSVDALYAVQGYGRFNSRTDVVKEGNRLSVSAEFFDVFLFNPTKSLERITDLAQELRRFGVDGINYESIGDLLYHDYNDRAPSSRAETLATWGKMMQLSKEALGKASLWGASVELAAAADMLFKVPMESSRFIVLDEEVPFFQMVIHGSVPYAGDPANLFHDTRGQYLRWIEFGCIPHYELTYQRSERLAYTGYNLLFTSYYKDWLSTAATQHEEFNENFGGFYHLEMVDHERRSDGLVRVQYSDGSLVYLNYGSQPVLVDGIRVPAEDYTVIRGGSL